MIAVLPPKQPNEKWFIPFDFSNPLNSPYNPDSTEILGGIREVRIEDVSAGQDVTAEMTDEAVCRVYGQTAYIWVVGGQSGHRYKITCRVFTDKSQQEFELEAFLEVRET